MVPFPNPCPPDENVRTFSKIFNHSIRSSISIIFLLPTQTVYEINDAFLLPTFYMPMRMQEGEYLCSMTIGSPERVFQCFDVRVDIVSI